MLNKSVRRFDTSQDARAQIPQTVIFVSGQDMTSYTNSSFYFLNHLIMSHL